MDWRKEILDLAPLCHLVNGKDRMDSPFGSYYKEMTHERMG